VNDAISKQKYYFSHCAYLKSSQIDIYRAFYGLVTHFKVECPSKPITTYNDPANNGAICMPFYGFNDFSQKPTVMRKMG